MKHIVFQEADIAVLQKAIDLDETLNGEIIQIKDDFAVGPIVDIYETEGYQQRRDWWKGLLQFSPYTEAPDIVDDKLTFHNLVKQLTEDKALQLWIWMGQNQHDVCGYYWLMSQLKDYQGQIQVLYLNNLPFINEKGGLFYPSNLFEIQPKEFLKAKRLARPVTLSEFELDPDEWKKLCTENAIVRILEGGKKIVSKEETYYDKQILLALGSDTLKLPKLLGNIFNKIKVKTGDIFLVWRMKQMVKDGQLLMQGEWEKGWKDIVLKAATGNIFEQVVVEEDEHLSDQ